MRALAPGALRPDPSPMQVRALAREMMLRRKKEEVLTDLPDLVSHIEYVDLLPKQRRAYELAEEEGVLELRGHTVSIPGVFALIIRLKQICNGAGGQSAKTDWLRDHLNVTAAEGEKALVFSQFVQTLNALEMDLSDLSPMQFTGSLSGAQRTRLIDGSRSRLRRSARCCSFR